MTSHNAPPRPAGTLGSRSRRKAWIIAVFTILPTLMLLADAVAAAAEAPCPNQQAREQNNSIVLTDCRAYEMVSPLQKNGGDIPTPNDRTSLGDLGVVQATPDGERITYHSLAAFGKNPGGLPVQSQYLAIRNGGAWTTENITAPTTTTTTPNNSSLPYKAFDTNLTEGLLWNNAAGVEGQAIELEEAPIGEAPAGYLDYFRHNFATKAYQALITTRPPVEPSIFNIPQNLALEGDSATDDLKHIILKSRVELVPGVALGGENLYEWAGGHLEPVNLLPGAGPVETAVGAELGSSSGYQSRTLSADGSRVFWSVGTGAEALYAREGVGTPQAKTIQLDSGTGGNGLFLTASRNGAKAFFTTHTTGVGTGDLYEYDLENETLMDLTPTGHAEEARVQGVLGASDDGSYVYFVASGNLAAGAESESCEAKIAATGCNLYVWHEGTGITFIARLDGGDEQRSEEGGTNDWDEVFALRTARVSPDGHHVVFVSAAQLTSYDNAGTPEVYEYDAGSSGPVCVSCNPDGAKPMGPAGIPGAVGYNTISAVYAARVLTADGNRVFFNSGDALSSLDTNNKQDVYEWERAGTGSCEQAPGCVSLISAGTSSEKSTFVDASENGSDVYFTTRQELTPGDTDQQVDLYDARVNGGFTVANLPICTGTGCQGLPSAPPIFATPPTFTFDGAGNFPPPAKPHAPTRAQLLAKALKACAKKPRKQRPACQRRARSRYGAVRKTGRK